jgi:Mg-chelatase subunit ChlD
MKTGMGLLAPLAGLRIASVCLVALAAMDPRLPLPTRGRTCALVFDASDSVGSEGLEAARSAALGFLGHLDKGDRVAVLSFGASPSVLLQPSSPAEAVLFLRSASLTAKDPTASDPALAVSAAAALISGLGGSRDIYLFSDGRDSTGEGILPARFTRSGITLHAYPVGSSPSGVRSDGLELPAVARVGEETLASWSLGSDQETEIEWILSMDGLEAARGRALLPAGTSSLSVRVPAAQPGSHAVTLEARGADGRSIPAATAGGLLAVSGPAQVLVIGGGHEASPVAAALRAQGMAARYASVEEMPSTDSGWAGIQAAVLDDVNALYMSEAQQSRLLAFVSGGGGLLVIGGEESLGRGEYYATPIEDLLPVETDTRRRLFFTRAKILFVIDNSGSMSELVNGISKQSAAMRGVADSIPDLSPQDEVGILSFDDTPTWVLPFTRADKRETILESMTRMKEGGGTDLAEAIQEIIRGFGAAGPMRRHAIIISDGHTLDADFQSLSRSLNGVGVTVTTIGVGEDINEQLLRELAEWNGGAFYRAETDQIPRVVNKETVRVTRDLIQEGSFAQVEVDPSPASRGIAGQAPPVKGYLVTTAKPLARVHLAVGQGQDRDPLLASWRYGSGKVAVFASDSGERWLAEWTGRPVYSRLWSQVLREIERGNPDSGMLARAYAEHGAIRLVVEAVHADRRAASGLDLQGRSTTAGSAPFSLRETAPGRYEALVSDANVLASGLQRFEIRDSREGTWCEAWIWRPSNSETDQLGPDLPALARAAEETGGSVYLDQGPFPRPERVSWRPIRLGWVLLLVGLILFVIELYGRSTLFGQLKMARATLQAWWKIQKLLADRLDGLLDEKRPTPPPAKDDTAKVMDAYRRLAERSLQRSRKEAAR